MKSTLRLTFHRRHSKAQKAGFVRSLAESLYTSDKAVAVTGGLAGANHLELVIAVEEDHYDSSGTLSQVSNAFLSLNAAF